MGNWNVTANRDAGVLWFKEETYSPANSLWKTCPLAAIASDPAIAHVYYNDFFTFTSGEAGLAATLTDSGTAAIATATGTLKTGVLSLTCSDGTVADNDEAYVGSESAPWILASDKDLWFECAALFTEQATDDANIMVGLSSTYAANALVDNGAGPAANYHGIDFFKVDGGTVWQCECSAAASQTTLSSVATRVSGSWTRLGFHVTGNSTVDFFINGVEVGQIATNLPTSGVGLFFGAKNGGANNEVLHIDYVKLVQLR